MTDKELIKQAFKLGYEQGLKKQAKPISLDDYKRARRILGFPEYDDDTDYKRYLGDRKRNLTVTPAILAALFGLAGGATGYQIGDDYNGEGGKGALIGALTGGGIGALEGLGLGAISNWAANRRLQRFAIDQLRHDADKPKAQVVGAPA